MTTNADQRDLAHDEQVRLEVREQVAVEIEARLVSANSHGEHFGLLVAASIARYGGAR